MIGIFISSYKLTYDVGAFLLNAIPFFFVVFYFVNNIFVYFYILHSFIKYFSVIHTVFDDIDIHI